MSMVSPWKLAAAFRCNSSPRHTAPPAHVRLLGRVSHLPWRRFFSENLPLLATVQVGWNSMRPIHQGPRALNSHSAAQSRR